MSSGSVLGLVAILYVAVPMSSASAQVGLPAAGLACGNVRTDASASHAASPPPQCASQPQHASGAQLAATKQGEQIAAIEGKSGHWKHVAAAIVAEDIRQEGVPGIFGAERGKDKYAEFSAAFAEAKVPDCLHKDGLKRQPPRIGFFVFQGVLAFPFVALAKVRGKCR